MCRGSSCSVQKGELVLAANNANVISLNSASTTIPTGSYVQLSASTPIGTTQIILVNATSSTIRLGYGASGSEVGLVGVAPNSWVKLNLGSIGILPAGTRLALEAVDTQATSGYVTVSLLL